MFYPNSCIVIRCHEDRFGHLQNRSFYYVEYSNCRQQYFPNDMTIYIEYNVSYKWHQRSGDTSILPLVIGKNSNWSWNDRVAIQHLYVVCVVSLCILYTLAMISFQYCHSNIIRSHIRIKRSYAQYILHCFSVLLLAMVHVYIDMSRNL